MSGITTRWFLGMVMGSAIIINANCALAQSNIVPDNTLGNESSVVIPNINGYAEVITGGAQRGANLFHSFREFNVTAVASKKNTIHINQVSSEALQTIAQTTALSPLSTQLQRQFSHYAQT